MKKHPATVPHHCQQPMRVAVTVTDSTGVATTYACASCGATAVRLSPPTAPAPTAPPPLSVRASGSPPAPPPE